MLLAIIPQNATDPRNATDPAGGAHLRSKWRSTSRIHMQRRSQLSGSYKNILKLEHILPYILWNVFRKLKTEDFITDGFTETGEERKSFCQLV